MSNQRVFLLSYVVCVHVLCLAALLPPTIKYQNLKTKAFIKKSAGEELNNSSLNLVKNKQTRENKHNQTSVHQINTSLSNPTEAIKTNISSTTESSSTSSTISSSLQPVTATNMSSTPSTSTTSTTLSSTNSPKTTTTTNSSSNSTTTSYSESTSTPYLESTTTEHNSPHPLPGWALGLILCLVTVVIIIITFFIFIRYRRSKIPLAQPVHSLLGQITRKSVMHRTSRPIPLSSFPSVYRNKFMDETFHKEFREIQDYSADLNVKKSRDVGKREENRNRNRFVDIIPFDDNYVTLNTREGNPPSDYINASYVEELPKCGKFIVTQGPKQNTVVEFWKMIVEKQCRTIIMLTNLQEAGRVKCFQYWPPSGQMLHFDDISLFTTEEIEIHTGTMARKIEVSMEDDPESEVFTVRQLHLTNWPDHGVPETTNSLLAFLRVSRDFIDQGYTVIHCSAGVGRTGTYLALLSLTEQIRNGAETVDVLSTVKSLRERRSKMVQTEEQYIFLHQAITDFIKTGEGAAVLPGDDVLDDGVDNFGFEHVRL